MEPAASEIDLWIFSPISEGMLYRADCLGHREQTFHFFRSKN
jgi:hypothetical protein